MVVSCRASSVGEDTNAFHSQSSNHKIRIANKLASESTSPQTSFTVEGCEGPYIDYWSVPLMVIKKQMQSPQSKRKGPRGGVSEPFPVKLYEMLVGVEQEGLDHIVSWKSHGRCFMIHLAQAFVDDIMPR
jgi:HSF-type DNA-binding